jgi:hypothetical protein
MYLCGFFGQGEKHLSKQILMIVFMILIIRVSEIVRNFCY